MIILYINILIMLHGSAYRKQRIGLTEAGNSVLTLSVFYGLAGIFACARVYSLLLSFA